VAEAAVTFAFITIGMTLGSYVFGAAWEDISKVRVGQSDPWGAGSGAAWTPPAAVPVDEPPSGPSA